MGVQTIARELRDGPQFYPCRYSGVELNQQKSFYGLLGVP